MHINPIPYVPSLRILRYASQMFRPRESLDDDTPPNHFRSQGIFEALQAFDWLLQRAIVDFLVLPQEITGHGADAADDPQLQSDGRPQPAAVLGRLGLFEGCRREDAADSTEANEQGAADAPLGLHADVVGLVGQHCGNVALAPGGAEEEAEVSDAVTRVVSRDHEADNGEERLDDDEGTSETELVSQPGERHGAKDCEAGWWRGESVSCSCAVSHALHQGQ